MDTQQQTWTPLYSQENWTQSPTYASGVKWENQEPLIYKDSYPLWDENEWVKSRQSSENERIWKELKALQRKIELIARKTETSKNLEHYLVEKEPGTKHNPILIE